MENYIKFYTMDLLILSFVLIILILSILKKAKKLIALNILLFILFFVFSAFKEQNQFFNFIYYTTVALSLIPLYISSRELEILYRKNTKDKFILKIESRFLKREFYIKISKKLKKPIIIEFLSIGYFSFFIQFLIFGVLFFFKDKELLIACFNTNIIVFITGFTISFFFSVKGPRYHLKPILKKEGIISDSNIPLFKGYILTKTIISIIRKFGKKAGAFPSLHSAANIIFVFFAFKYHPLIGLIWLLVTFLLFVSCIFFQFHYFLDIIGGILISILIIFLTNNSYYFS